MTETLQNTIKVTYLEYTDSVLITLLVAKRSGKHGYVQINWSRSKTCCPLQDCTFAKIVL